MNMENTICTFINGNVNETIINYKGINYKVEKWGFCNNIEVRLSREINFGVIKIYNKVAEFLCGTFTVEDFMQTLEFDSEYVDF